jgi:hypothetical protein
MFKVRVIWDVDCILSDMIPFMCKSINRDYHLRLQPEDIKEWDLRKVTGIP